MGIFMGLYIIWKLYPLQLFKAKRDLKKNFVES